MPPVQLRPRFPRRLASAPEHAATQRPAAWDRPFDALSRQELRLLFACTTPHYYRAAADPPRGLPRRALGSAGAFALPPSHARPQRPAQLWVAPPVAEAIGDAPEHALAGEQ